MTIISDNVFNSVGDTLYIGSDFLGHVQGVSSCGIDTIGETPNRHIIPYFSYSMDGVNWSNYLALSMESFDSVQFTGGLFWIRYKFVRGGSDTSGQVTLTGVSVDGFYSVIGSIPSYGNTIFSPFFGYSDTEVVDLASNLTEKLYREGIVPKYIKRGLRGNTDDGDTDYLSFWRAVAHFAALYITYCAQFLKIRLNVGLARDYLLDRDMMIGDLSGIVALRQILSKRFNHMRYRGTDRAFSKSTQLGTGLVSAALGEFPREINLGKDEYAVTMTPADMFGWCIGHSSPIYRGSYLNPDLVRGYEAADGVSSLALYPTVGSVAKVLDPISGRNVIKLSVTDSGIGGVSKSKRILIDKRINYEMTFGLLQRGACRVVIGVQFFNDSGTAISSVMNIDGSAATWMNTEYVTPIKGRYYFIRVLMIGVNYQNYPTDGSYLDFGHGKKLRIPCGAKYIIPKIIFKGSSTGGYALIDNMKVRIADTVYSSGFLNRKNVIQIWAKDKNDNHLSNAVQLSRTIHPLTFNKLINYPRFEGLIDDRLIPYNSVAVINWIGNESRCDKIDLDGQINPYSPERDTGETNNQDDIVLHNIIEDKV